MDRPALARVMVRPPTVTGSAPKVAASACRSIIVFQLSAVGEPACTPDEVFCAKSSRTASMMISLGMPASFAPRTLASSAV